MSSVSMRAVGGVGRGSSANERLKESWGRYVWGSVSLGIVVHFALFALAPRMEIPVVAMKAGPAPQLLRIGGLGTSAVSAPAPEISIPVPALPTMKELALEFTFEPTIPMPDIGEGSPLDDVLVPPLETEKNEWLEYQSFAPYVVRPEIRNRTELKKFLERHYQPILEFSGATGVVQVSFWIDEAGLVERAEIAKSSGSRSLDRLAMRLSRVLRFRPAMLAGRPVRMQVRLPITFRAA